MTYLSYGIRGVLALVFLAAGGAKLAGVPVFVEGFEALGMGQWFRHVTGIVEVAGAILLWWPNRQVLGAVLLGATMVGATLANLFAIGDSVVPSLVLGALCATVLYLHRNQLAVLRGTNQAS